MDPSPNDPAPGPTLSNAVPDAEPVPFGQRFFDNTYVLLAIGVLIMLIVFTGWGIFEIVSMPQGTLP